MQTYFAPAERASEEKLQTQLEYVTGNSIINCLLSTAGGLLAVLNQQRQILAVNDTFLRSLGVMDSSEILGLRLGESVKCIHSDEMPGGCGTAQSCASCGGVIAMVASLDGTGGVERKCAVTVKQGNGTADLCLKVRACSVDFLNERFILLFLQDITPSERWAAWERTFFHDLGNLVTGLLGAVDCYDMVKEENRQDLMVEVRQMALRLAGEITAQNALLRDDLADYQIKLQEVTVARVGTELEGMFVGHAVARGKRLHTASPWLDCTFRTDLSLLLRVLGNMLKNAFEATLAGGTVAIDCRKDAGRLVFSVHNEGVIPEAIAGRIFQRYFSTKSEAGRGMGTYSMRLLGEHFLGGKVAFTTSREEGTTFSLSLPLE